MFHVERVYQWVQVEVEAKLLAEFEMKDLKTDT